MPDLLVNGCILHYETAGEGPPLLMLHGLGSSSRDWEYQVPELSRHYRLIMPDFRGFGRSDHPPGPYSITGFAEDMRLLLKALEVEQPHVLGYSMGGAVAFQMAVAHPEEIASLIIVNSVASFRVDTPAKYFELYLRLFVARVLGMERMARIVASRLFPKPEQAGLKHKMIARYADNEAHAYIAAIRGLVNWDVTDLLGRIDKPVLVISADQDYSSLEDKEGYVNRLRNVRFELIRDSRHGTPIEKPEEFNALVLDFLKNVAELNSPVTR